MAPRQRVLAIDLDALERDGEPRLHAPACARPARAAIAGWGGTALGLVSLLEEIERAPGAGAPLVVAAGAAVREGLPTAARASLLSVAPLSGLFAEGHVGGELGPRLAGLADALLLTGRARGPAGVLCVGPGERCELVARPELAGASPAEAIGLLEREHAPCSVLAIGPAGERGLPCASLASGSPPSFVGRGGLGAVLGRMGLKALLVRGEPVRAQPHDRSRALRELLARSPRLAARAEGGTLELFETLAARGADRAGSAAGLAREARASAAARTGCRGCPTPCGWVFERAGGERQGARFGATLALGPGLGLETLDDALALLALCDRLGADAKEVGAILALVCQAQERGLLPGSTARGERDELARRIQALIADERAPGRAGAAALARELGLEREQPASRGQALRPGGSAVELLGQCVSAGGADPMRSFPFLLDSAAADELAHLLAPLPVPESALDPQAPDAKGRLVFWHENLISAVDMTGFCAFSAAGLLGDGLTDLDGLARWILPPALLEPDDPAWSERPSGQRLLAAGANLVLLRRELNQVLGAAPDQDRPAFARARLEQPGMLDEYLALRALDQHGYPRPEALVQLGSPALLELGLSALAPVRREPPGRTEPFRPRARGRVTLRGSGALGRALGGERQLELDLPRSVAEVLARASAGDELLRAQLFAGQRLIPAVWRRARRLAPHDPVENGDVLELVVAISGG